MIRTRTAHLLIADAVGMAPSSCRWRITELAESNVSNNVIEDNGRPVFKGDFEFAMDRFAAADPDTVSGRARAAGAGIPSWRSYLHFVLKFSFSQRGRGALSDSAASQS
jgi:hypothetical protein